MMARVIRLIRRLALMRQRKVRITPLHTLLLADLIPAPGARGPTWLVGWLHACLAHLFSSVKLPAHGSPSRKRSVLKDVKVFVINLWLAKCKS